MSEKFHILVVDDQIENFNLVKIAVKSEYQLSHVASGEECLDKITGINPYLVLMDIQMPGIDGYEVCKRIKENEETSAIPVIFVSGYDSIEERLKAYEVGAVDYIIKPFHAAELKNKISIAINNRKNQEWLKSEVSVATQTTLSALSTSAEIGIVLNFLQQSQSCNTLEALGEKVIEAIDQYGLKSTVQVRHDEDVINVGSDKIVQQLESTLLDKLASKGRIFDFGARSVFNFPHISLLIKNMPVEDEAKYGRHKDNLALLVEGAEARITSIIAEITIEKQQQALLSLLDNTKKALSEIDKKNYENKTSSIQIMSDLIFDVEKEFITLGLSEAQESRLLELIKQAADRSEALYGEGLEVDKRIAEIVSDFDKVLS
jgi:CheY-like chemotaxis protein